MDGDLWEEDITDSQDALPMEVDPAEATELVNGNVVGEAGASLSSTGHKAGGEAAGANGSKAGSKVVKKTRRTKWVPTQKEVDEAFESIKRVKYESPTRLMGKSMHHQSNGTVAGRLTLAD